MNKLQIHIFIDHQSHSQGPLPNHRNVASPDAANMGAVASPPAVQNTIQNPFPTFNVQHQTPSNRNQTPPQQHNATAVINDHLNRPSSRGGASSSNSSINSEADAFSSCDLCGMTGIPNREAYKQV